MGLVEANTESYDTEQLGPAERLYLEYQNVSIGLETFVREKRDLVFPLTGPGHSYPKEVIDRLQAEYRGGMRTFVDRSANDNERTAYWVGVIQEKGDSRKSETRETKFYVVEHYDKSRDEWQNKEELEFTRAYVILKEPKEVQLRPPQPYEEPEISRIRKFSRNVLEFLKLG